MWVAFFQETYKALVNLVGLRCSLLCRWAVVSLVGPLVPVSLSCERGARQATLSTIFGYISGAIPENWFTNLFTWLSILSVIPSALATFFGPAFHFLNAAQQVRLPPSPPLLRATFAPSSLTSRSALGTVLRDVRRPSGLDEPRRGLGRCHGRSCRSPILPPAHPQPALATCLASLLLTSLSPLLSLFPAFLVAVVRGDDTMHTEAMKQLEVRRIWACLFAIPVCCIRVVFVAV